MALVPYNSANNASTEIFFRRHSQSGDGDGAGNGTGAGNAVTGVVGLIDSQGNEISSSAPLIGAGITSTEILAAYTRPSNTTAYSDNDALSDSTSSPTALTFSLARANDISGYIAGARIAVSHASGSFTNELRLWLFRDLPTAINDNSPFTVGSGLASNRPIAVLRFTSWFTGGSSSTRSISYGVFPQERLIPFNPSSDTDQLFGLVQVPYGFTPESGQTFEFYLSVESN